MGMTRRLHSRIELEIGELILDGFTAGDRDAIAASLTRELTRLLGAESAAPFAPARQSVDRVDGGSITLPAKRHPDAVGVELARAIYRSVTP